jgi:hypothetical protein
LNNPAVAFVRLWHAAFQYSVLSEIFPNKKRRRNETSSPKCKSPIGDSLVLTVPFLKPGYRGIPMIPAENDPIGAAPDVPHPAKLA